MGNIKNNNNFDCLRLVAAILVIYAHAYLVKGIPQPFLFCGQIRMSLGTLGVTIFFVTSGYLISGSYLRNKGRILDYAKARILRIYPALIFQYFIVIAVIGSIASSLNHIDYFRQVLAIPRLALVPFQFNFPDLPGVFNHVVLKNEVNSSLWTLLFEVRMYILIPLILRFNLIIPALLAYGLYLYAYNGFVPDTMLDLGLMHCFSFLMGSMFYVFKDRIKLNTAVAAILLILLLLSNNMVIYALSTAYIVIWLAFVPLHCNLAKYGDYSYGLYLYGFPIQQLFVNTQMNFFLYLLLTFGVTLFFAVISWHLIEMPFLALKKRID